MENPTIPKSCVCVLHDNLMTAILYNPQLYNAVSGDYPLVHSESLSLCCSCDYLSCLFFLFFFGSTSRREVRCLCDTTKSTMLQIKTWVLYYPMFLQCAHVTSRNTVRGLFMEVRLTSFVDTAHDSERTGNTSSTGFPSQEIPLPWQHIR